MAVSERSQESNKLQLKIEGMQCSLCFRRPEPSSRA